MPQVEKPPPNSLTALEPHGEGSLHATLEFIEQRVLWLATRIIDAANRRGDAGGIKVGW